VVVQLRVSEQHHPVHHVPVHGQLSGTECIILTSIVVYVVVNTVFPFQNLAACARSADCVVDCCDTACVDMHQQLNMGFSEFVTLEVHCIADMEPLPCADSVFMFIVAAALNKCSLRCHKQTHTDVGCSAVHGCTYCHSLSVCILPG
jgi:hypothetical protein